MSSLLIKKDFIQKYTIFKGRERKIIIILIQNVRDSAFSCLQKTVYISKELSDGFNKNMELELEREIKNESHILPPHPQILPLLKYEIIFKKNKNMIKINLFYNLTNYIPFNQYIYRNSLDSNKIQMCFCKIGNLLYELSQICILKFSFFNLFLDNQDNIFLILPPFSFFNQSSEFDDSNENVFTIIPPELEESIVPEKFYSYLLGAFMLLALEKKFFFKVIKNLKDSNIKEKLIQLINSNSNKRMYLKQIYTKEMIEIICNCLEYNSERRISISNACIKIAKIVNKNFKKSPYPSLINSGYFINSSILPKYCFFQKWLNLNNQYINHLFKSEHLLFSQTPFSKDESLIKELGNQSALLSPAESNQEEKSYENPLKIQISNKRRDFYSYELNILATNVKIQNNFL